jgi:hypothetical protein
LIATTVSLSFDLGLRERFMADTEDAPRARNDAIALDLFGAGSLGILLGILIGMSASPTVSIVITALVALLAGLFGLSEKSTFAISPDGARRLGAFAIAATLASLLGVWMRTHETLSPSLDQQRATLRELGLADKSKEQIEMLKFLRYGLVPAGSAVSKEPKPWIGVFYNDAAPSLCADLNRAESADDIITVLKAAGAKSQSLASEIAKIPPDRRNDAANVVRMTLCSGN